MAFHHVGDYIHGNQREKKGQCYHREKSTFQLTINDVICLYELRASMILPFCVGSVMPTCESRSCEWPQCQRVAGCTAFFSAPTPPSKKRSLLLKATILCESVGMYIRQIHTFSDLKNKYLLSHM